MNELDVHTFQEDFERNLDILIQLEFEKLPFEYAPLFKMLKFSFHHHLVRKCQYLKDFLLKIRKLFLPQNSNNNDQTFSPIHFKGHNDTLKRTFKINNTFIEFNSGHGYRRSGHKKGSAREIGTMDEIECAIQLDFSKMNKIYIPFVPKYIERTILVNGKQIGYRITQTPDNIKRVSTYYPK